MKVHFGRGILKILAYYLPQFYETDYNNKWHGKGFTEWTKTREARPLFKGHYQPRIPHPSLGHYSFSADLLRTQAQLAKRGGVNGFIFYHYDFDGQRILEEPSDTWLSEKDIDIPICFCWANESWTRNWDGGSKDILAEQRYSPGFAHRFVSEIAPFISDPRYLRIRSQPLLLIYRPHLIPDANEFIQEIRLACQELGLPRLFLAGVDTTPFASTQLEERYPRFDTWIQRPMYQHRLLQAQLENSNHQVGSNFKGLLLNYSDVKDFYLSESLPDFMHGGATVGWDVTARHGKNSLILKDFSRSAFSEWIETLAKRELSLFGEDEQLVAVTAWNEWAEGAYLEPDLSFGFEYLDAIREGLQRAEGLDG